MAYLQSKSANEGTTAAFTSVAYSSALTTGSSLVGAAYWASGSATCTVTDPTNGTWTAIGSPVVGSGGLAGFSAQAFWLPSNSGTTALTATASISGSVTARGFAIHEYSGGLRSLEAHAESMKAGIPNPSSATETPAAATDLVFSWIVCGGSESAVAGGFTRREVVGFGSNGTADITSPSAGVGVAAQWTTSTNDNIVGIEVFSLPANTVAAFLVYGHTGLARVENIEAWLNANMAGWLPATQRGLNRLNNIEDFLTSNPVNSVTFLPYGKTGTDRMWNIESYLLSATSSNG